MWILLGYSSSKFQHTGSIIHIHWTFLFNFFSKHFSTLLVHIKRKQNLKQEKMWILLKCRLVVPSSTLASDCKYYGTSTFLVIHLYGMSCWIKKVFPWSILSSFADVSVWGWWGGGPQNCSLPRASESLKPPLLLVDVDVVVSGIENLYLNVWCSSECFFLVCDSFFHPPRAED